MCIEGVEATITTICDHSCPEEKLTCLRIVIGMMGNEYNIEKKLLGRLLALGHVVS